MLDTVNVTARGGCARTTFDGFLCRRRASGGVFLTEADILAKSPTYLADIFAGMEGFRIEAVPTPYGARRDVRVASTRCLVTLMNGRPFVGRDSVTSEADFFRPEHLIGVEVYPPGTVTPVEYGNLAVATSRNTTFGGVRGSRMTPRRRRVAPVEERCVLINYWTPSAIRKK